MALPRSVDVLKEIAAEYGVCVRPLAMRRTDLNTGLTEVIDLPCGATREDKCAPYAKKNRRLRQAQIREGWHRDDEPLPPPEPATEEQKALVLLRGHLEFSRDEASRASQWDQATDLDEAIREVEDAITAEGLRGRVAPPHTTGDEDQDDEDNGRRRKRSTRRRQDAPDLPRRKVERRTVGKTYTAPDGSIYRPSMWLTLTLDSYGPVRPDGTPLNPDRYDYRRAAWDAVHFPRLLDRFWQNLRRCEGWNVQYAGSVEPQRRLAPHAHFAIRGTIPRDVLRTVAAATYHQVWWPSVDVQRYTLDRLPVWDEQAAAWVDPDTRAPLTTWSEALDAIDDDPDAEPVHVVRFGSQVDARGVMPGTEDAERTIRYVTKYITKHTGDVHKITSGRQRAHLDRLLQELQLTPCTERCANWLLYGVQPKGGAREAQAEPLQGQGPPAGHPRSIGYASTCCRSSARGSWPRSSRATSGSGMPRWSASLPRRPGPWSSPTCGPSLARPSTTSGSPRTRVRQSRSSRRDLCSAGWCHGPTTRFRQSAVVSPTGTARWSTWVPAVGCAKARSWGSASTTSTLTRDGCMSRVRSSSSAPGSFSGYPRTTGTAGCRCRTPSPRCCGSTSRTATR
ncbi:hypothetical protein Misp05_36980 [Micromonospora sp. NBRC 107095]|nr:hypothetical protein Misp05_36980 [Micromonospora sp. NBRC 107095]